MPNSIEFDRLVSYFDADLSGLKSGVAEGTKLVDKFENRIKNLKLELNLNVSGTGAAANIDPEMRKAQAIIAKYQKQTAAGEAALTRSVEKEAEAQTRIKMK